MKISMVIFLVLAVSQRVQSQTRLVVNTTCLELAKPSNQQLRLSCRQYDYHCLLDESYTKEFEVCRQWKWIPVGKCAYFNTYGSGNIDQTNCIRKTNLTCSNGTDDFSSLTNTKYTACYVKKEISTSLPSTTSPTGTQSDGGNATSDSTTRDKQYERSGTTSQFAEHVGSSNAVLYSTFIIYIFVLVFLVIFIFWKKEKYSNKDQI